LSGLSADNVVGLIVSVLLVAYLTVALLLPERF
jgi:K+-transporting ATPase KdpF subunit